MDTQRVLEMLTVLLLLGALHFALFQITCGLMRAGTGQEDMSEVLSEDTQVEPEHVLQLGTGLVLREEPEEEP